MARRPLAYVIALLMSAPLNAVAHSSLVEAVPHDGAVVAAGDVMIELRFDSRLDVRFCQVKVVKSDGSQLTLTRRDGDNPSVLKVIGASLNEGRYLVQWQVLSVDGHADHGQISFGVGR